MQETPATVLRDIVDAAKRQWSKHGSQHTRGRPTYQNVFDRQISENTISQSLRTGRLKYSDLMIMLESLDESERAKLEYRYLKAQADRALKSRNNLPNLYELVFFWLGRRSEHEWMYIGSKLIDNCAESISTSPVAINSITRTLIFDVRNRDGELHALRNAVIPLQFLYCRYKSVGFPAVLKNQDNLMSILNLCTSVLELSSLSNVKEVISHVQSILIDVSADFGFPMAAKWLIIEADAQLAERRHDGKSEADSIRNKYNEEVLIVEDMLRQGRSYPEWLYFHRGRINAFWNLLLMIQLEGRKSEVSSFMTRFRDAGSQIQETNAKSHQFFSALAPQERSGNFFEAHLFADQHLMRTSRDRSISYCRPDLALEELTLLEKTNPEIILKFLYNVKFYSLKTEVGICMMDPSLYEEGFSKLSHIARDSFFEANQANVQIYRLSLLAKRTGVGIRNA